MKTQSAMAAKAIKEELKKAFPFIKFSVTSDNYSMGDSVRIHYTDGVKLSRIEEITDKYQYGSFNGMEDIYENTNERSDIPQAKYVNVDRRRSEDAEKTIIDILKKEVDPDFDTNKRYGENWGSQLIWFKFRDMEFLPETKQDERKEVTKINGSFQIIDYSEKAIAVFGDTKPIKDQLKDLGGRFNPYLTHEGNKKPGWVFSKIHKEQIESFLTNAAHSEHTEQKNFNKEINLYESLKKKAESTREQAEKINTQIHGDWTSRRQRMADSQQHKQDILFKIARILECLSTQWQNGTIPQDLKCIKSRSDVEMFLYSSYPEKPERFDGWYAKEYPARKKKVDLMGIKNKEHYKTIESLLRDLCEIELTEEQKKQKELNELTKKIHAANIPGFFPTPDHLIEQMIDISGITHVKNILEPSAGIGSICDRIKDLCDNLECCELQYTLFEFLQKKDFNVICRDIYNIEERTGFYNAIFMNPPFECREDLKQVMFCYNLLANGGRLVSIISSGTMTKEFLSWISDKDYEIFDTEQGSFKGSFNSTGVSCKIILINK